MAYSKKDRIKIHLRAKRRIGLIKQGDSQDESDFIEQCIINLTEDGSVDEDDARDACEAIWEDRGGDVDN